ncbi:MULTISPECIES: putative sugar nucleotidyl transferase [Sphingobacterium]|uniref:Transferase n=1 Tax=Sphingobacterium litopenaei TaxID=2763500 RepID=A0ABR7YGL6_9SPHI|nr:MULTISPECIES: putative sugar nucleotidyl transferase [Sphingobacterium]MBD1430454.1 transferase [Sphingobacterium litopenaei]NGM73990.1 transferase [Sphingobacterium sp. SGL-16]
MSISLVLFDRFEGRNHLLPLVATRPIGNLRVGAFTLDQKWSHIFETEDVSYLTEDYLSSKFPLNNSSEFVLLIKASVLPNSGLVRALKNLKANEKLVDANGEWIALLTQTRSKEELLLNLHSSGNKIVSYLDSYDALLYVEDIFTYNASQIEYDAQFIFQEKNGNTLENHLYIADSAQVAPDVVLNTSRGPILILDNAVLESHNVIHGPTIIGKNVRVKSGTIIYPNVTVGDNSTVCGELNNVVIWGNSAKGHYGYLGCAVIGDGCNLGAGTLNSNLKNDWSEIKVYDYVGNNFRNTGLLKCGVFIGDHSMLAISSKLNTGTIIGVGAQVAMSNFIPKFVPDFSWLTDDKSESYIFTRFMDMLSRKAEIKKEAITNKDKEILEYIYKQTKQIRNY